MKKLIALLLAVLMLLSVFTACAPEPTPTPDPDPQPTPTPDDPDPTPDPDPQPTTGLQADGSYIYEDGVVMSAPGEFPIVKEGEVTLKIGMFHEANVTSYEYGENQFTTYLQDRSGITIEFDRLGSTSAEALTQIQLRIATGETLPDIVLNSGPSRLDCWDYMEDGILLPLNEYIENYGYYYDKAVEEMQTYNPELIGAIHGMDDPDGNMPLLWKFDLGPGSQYDKQAYINKAWLDTLGMEVPDTIDELYEVLVAFRDKDPNGNGLKDEIPMLGAANEAKGSYVPNICDVILTAFCYFNPRQHLVDEGDGKITFVGVTEGFREGMKWIRKCVDEGLIPDFNFTQDNAQQKAIVDPVDPEAPTVVGVVVENPTFSHNLDESDRIFEYVALPCLTGPEGICYSSCYDTAMLFQNWITGDCQYPEIAFRFMDMFYDREVTWTMQYGFEGEGWMWADEWAEEQGIEVEDIFNRYAEIIPGSKVECIQLRDGFNAYSQNHAYTWAIIPIYYVPTGAAMNVHYSSALNGFDPTNTRNYVSIIHDQGLMTRMGKIPETNVPGTLLNGLTAEEEAATTAMRGNLNVHFFNTRTAFQTGELDIYDDQVWQDYLDQLEAYGMSTVLKIYQNCYDRYLANQG